MMFIICFLWMFHLQWFLPYFSLNESVIPATFQGLSRRRCVGVFPWNFSHGSGGFLFEPVLSLQHQVRLIYISRFSTWEIGVFHSWFWDSDFENLGSIDGVMNLLTYPRVVSASNRNPTPTPNPNPNMLLPIISSAQVWPTIDGPLGLTEEASVDYARRFYKFGFALLPWLWAVKCFYFCQRLWRRRHLWAIKEKRMRLFYYYWIWYFLIIYMVQHFFCYGSLAGINKRFGYRRHDPEPFQATYQSIRLIRVMRKVFRSFIYKMIAFYKYMKRGLNRFCCM